MKIIMIIIIKALFDWIRVKILLEVFKKLTILFYY